MGEREKTGEREGEKTRENGDKPFSAIVSTG